jgi:hypothetical protein
MQHRSLQEDTGSSASASSGSTLNSELVSRKANPDKMDEISGSTPMQAIHPQTASPVHRELSSTAPQLARAPSLANESRGPIINRFLAAPNPPALETAKPTAEVGPTAISRIVHEARASEFPPNQSWVHREGAQRSPESQEASRPAASLSQREAFPGSVAATQLEIIHRTEPGMSTASTSGEGSRVEPVQQVPVPVSPKTDSQTGMDSGAPGPQPPIASATLNGTGADSVLTGRHVSAPPIVHLARAAQADFEMAGASVPAMLQPEMIAPVASPESKAITVGDRAERSTADGSPSTVEQVPATAAHTVIVGSVSGRNPSVTHRRQAVPDLPAKTPDVRMDRVTAAGRDGHFVSRVSPASCTVAHETGSSSFLNRTFDTRGDVQTVVRSLAAEGNQTAAMAFRIPAPPVRTSEMTHLLRGDSLSASVAGSATGPHAGTSHAPSIMHRVVAQRAGSPIAVSVPIPTQAQEPANPAPSMHQSLKKQDLNQLANRVYELLVRRLASERQRRGN